MRDVSSSQAHATRATTTKAQKGIPPGWFILDWDWTTVVAAGEWRLVVQMFPEKGVESPIFACYQHWGYELEFYFVGWVPSFEDAEQWLRNELPGTIAVDQKLPKRIPGLDDLDNNPQYGLPQTEDSKCRT